MRKVCLLCLLPCATACSSRASQGARLSAMAEAGPMLDSVQTSIGPIDVPAGVEKTVCIVKSLGNADDFVASSITWYKTFLSTWKHKWVIASFLQLHHDVEQRLLVAVADIARAA